MDRSVMEDLVKRWVLAAPYADTEYEYSPWQLIHTKASAASPASPSAIGELESRIGRALPPSYRLFLEVTNGTESTFTFGYPREEGFFSAEAVDWATVIEASSIFQHWQEFDAPGGFHRRALSFFSRRELNDSYEPVFGQHHSCLSISPIAEKTAVWLNPLHETAEGEWACWDFHHQDQMAYRSFGDYFKHRVEQCETVMNKHLLLTDPFAMWRPFTDRPDSVFQIYDLDLEPIMASAGRGSELPRELIAQLLEALQLKSSAAAIQWIGYVSGADAVTLGAAAWEVAETQDEQGDVFSAIARHESPLVWEWLATKFLDSDFEVRERMQNLWHFKPEVASRIHELNQLRDPIVELPVGHDYTPQSREVGIASLVEGLESPRAKDGEFSALAWRILKSDPGDDFDLLCRAAEYPAAMGESAKSNDPKGVSSELASQVTEQKLVQAWNEEWPSSPWSLAYVREPDATTLLIESFAEALARSGDTRYVLEKYSFFFEVQRTPESQAALFELVEHGIEPLGSLARLGNEEAIAMLIDLLDSSDEQAWIAARLYESGSPAAVGPLVSCAEATSDENVRALAAATVARHQPGHPYLKRWALDGETQEAIANQWRSQD